MATGPVRVLADAVTPQPCTAFADAALLPGMAAAPPPTGSLTPSPAPPGGAAGLAPSDAIIVRHLLVRNIIGVDNWERKKKQDIIINLRLYYDITKAGV